MKLFEGWKPNRRTSRAVQPEPTGPMELIDGTDSSQVDLRQVPSARVAVSVESRLAALTDPQGLGAEKFRALATRLEHLRHRQELRSFQVTSGLAHEGKTLVAANLAVTFAQSLGTRVLLIERRHASASLSPLLGLEQNKRDQPLVVDAGCGDFVIPDETWAHAIVVFERRKRLRAAFLYFAIRSFCRSVIQDHGFVRLDHCRFNANAAVCGL